MGSRRQHIFDDLLSDAGGWSAGTRWAVFRNFLEVAHCEIAGMAHPDRRVHNRLMDRRDELLIVCGDEQFLHFGRMLCRLRMRIEREPGDGLGVIYEHEEWTEGKYGGQFFTPWDVCRGMAKMLFDGGRDIADRTAILTLHEPSCGSGRMILAFAEAMKDAGFEPRTGLWVDAVDVDAACFWMSYIQLSLAGIPAVVRRANVLSRQVWDAAFTPAAVELIAANPKGVDRALRLEGGGSTDVAAQNA